jgi:hypothetical protein
VQTLPALFLSSKEEDISNQQRETGKVMGAFFRRAWNDPVGSKVIAVAIVALAGLVATWTFWHHLLVWGLALVAFLFATTAMPNWLVGILLGPALVLIVLAAAVFVRASPNESPDPTRDYCEDHFLGAVWRWRYLNGHEIYSPTPFCPRCDAQIIPHQTSGYAIVDSIGLACDICSGFKIEFEESWDGLQDKVIRMIQLKIRNGEWINALRKAGASPP